MLVSLSDLECKLPVRPNLPCTAAMAGNREAIPAMKLELHTVANQLANMDRDVLTLSDRGDLRTGP
jgi:hypothetical protein